ncbi:MULTISPECIES: hypothetical protein [unclassified Streptomyces]|uniref:hypothetical protein n=1 Tax=unclassified Streptomyces TaxID=2593676 RepID=UPI002E2FEE1F|nr:MULTISPECIES: hypothetical protein [unclassified Streptomyces]WUC68134.1 hypothetical protein OG861_29985 [Streptomyces sp. NBC_00539]
MVLFLLLLLVAVVLGFIGVLAEGLFYLLIIGVVILIVDIVIIVFRLRSGGKHHVR